mgnify:FL=1
MDNEEMRIGFLDSLGFFWKDFKRSPGKTYRKVKAGRDWLLAKIEYLQSESAKWRTTFNVLKSPYSFLRACGLNPQMAGSLLFAGSVATTGVVAAEVMQPPSFSAGDAGQYLAPLDSPVFYQEEFNTLRLDLGTTPVGLVEITDISLGTAFAGSSLPQNETAVIQIGGKPAVVDPAFTETFLEVGHLIIDRWRCESLTISNSEAHKLIFSNNISDGMSVAAVPGTPRARGINGGNRADDMRTTSSTYDMLTVLSASSGVNGQIDVLKLSNIYSRGGSCLVDRVLAGTIEITFNEIGGDSSLSTKELVLEDTLVFKSFINEANIEEAMGAPAIQ